MKKILLIIALMTLPSAMSAQRFKTFIDIFGGTSFGGGKNIAGYKGDTHFDNVKTDLSFGLNVTEGVQLTDYLFAGVGFGGYTTLTGYSNDDHYYRERERVFDSFYFPFFADVRWTLDINRKITPFVDLKVGYQVALRLEDGEMYSYNGNYGSESYAYVRGRSGAYFMPSIGVRFGQPAGFNLGIAYNTSIRKQYISYKETNFGYEPYEVGRAGKGVFMVTFGADF